MGPFATAVAVGCLSALRWPSWLVAALLVALVIVQELRGDGAGRPMQLLLAAAIGVAAGWMCGYLSRLLLARRA